MKKHLLIALIAVGFISSLSAQILPRPNAPLHSERNPSNFRSANKLGDFTTNHNGHVNKTAADTLIYIDWAEVEFNRTSPGSVRGFAWDINNNYGNTDTGSIKSAFVSTPILFDAYDRVLHSFQSTDTLRIDTIWFRVLHEKNSGSSVTNSLVINLVDVDTNFAPTGTVFKRDTISTTTGLISTNSGHNWLDSSKYFYITYGNGSGFKLPPGKQFAVEFTYLGPVADTFGMRAFYKKNLAVSPNCAAPDSSSRLALITTAFRKYAYVNGGSFNQTLPEFSGTTMNDFWLDCNNDGVIVDSTDAWFIQAWDVFAAVTKTNSTLVSINNDVLSQALNIVPNPSTGEFTITMNLPQQISASFVVSDLQGREVYNSGEMASANFNQKIDLSHLNKGLYILSMNTNIGKVGKKLLLN